MIKIKHIFHDNTADSANGQDYLVGNKTSNTVMVVSCGDLNTPATATSATIAFYGKASGSNSYIPIKAFRSSDYKLVSTGTINESYMLDTVSFEGIRVTLTDVVGGNVTVVGEIID